MDLLSQIETAGGPIPASVTPITDLKNQKRVNRTLSKAVSLHLEGKLESAARLLTKAIESGEREPGLFSALGHIHYEMRDYEAAAHHVHATGGNGAAASHRPTSIWASARATCKDWRDAAESFHHAIENDGTRSDALLGLGISLIHTGHAPEALVPHRKVPPALPRARAGALR